jgi:hypothetical protein
MQYSSLLIELLVCKSNWNVRYLFRSPVCERRYEIALAVNPRVAAPPEGYEKDMGHAVGAEQCIPRLEAG